MEVLVIFSTVAVFVASTLTLQDIEHQIKCMAKKQAIDVWHSENYVFLLRW